MDRGRVSMPVGNVCKGGQIRVAWYPMLNWFDVDMEENKMVEFNHRVAFQHVTFPHEIFSAFFISHKLSPIFLENYIDGYWVGSVYMVRVYNISVCNILNI